MTSTQMEIFKRVQSGDLEGIREQLERLGETGTPDVLGLKDEGGRSVLLVACMLGRSDIARELVRYGAPVEEHTARGEREDFTTMKSFTALHKNRHTR